MQWTSQWTKSRRPTRSHAWSVRAKRTSASLSATSGCALHTFTVPAGCQRAPASLQCLRSREQVAVPAIVHALRCTSAAFDAHTRVQTASPMDLARRMLAKYATSAKVYDVDDEVPLSAFNWHKLGEEAPKIYKTAASASVDFMLGAVEPPKEKAKKERVVRKKAVLEKELRPDEMDTGKQEDKNETSKLTEAMFERVVEHHKKPYTHFILDPDSFAQTVENMFSIAMLVGNAKIALRTDPEWGMQVQLVKGESRGQPVQPQPKGDPAQMVLNMNYDMWQVLKSAVRATDCLTPHREAINFAYDGAAGGGAGEGKAVRAKKKQGRLTSSDDEESDVPGPSKKARA